jgi:hypothetical protein
VSDVIADQSGNDRSVADGTDGSWKSAEEGRLGIGAGKFRHSFTGGLRSPAAR